MRIMLTAGEVIASAIAEVADEFDVKVEDAFNQGVLSMDNSSPKSVTIGIPSLEKIASLAGAVWKRIKTALGEKPSGTIIIEGPFGKKTHVELKNISDEAELFSFFKSVLSASEDV